jgi:hypothetical protein
MTPIALTDRQLREVMDAANLVPWDLRDVYLQQVADQLRGRDLGDGTVYRVSHETARVIVRTARRTAFG